MWQDRIEAGRELGDELASRGYAERDNVVVMGIPRGGVEVAAEVAKRLVAPLDVVVVRKIGSPGNPEFAAGAVDPDGHILSNASARASDAYLAQAGEVERQEAVRRVEEYRGGRPPADLTGKVVIVTDDGIATGLTAHAAIEYLRGRGATSVVLAVPVMSPSAVRYLSPLVDELVALEAPAGFFAVGSYYGSFPQLEDAEVKELLARGT
jgi:putative phosphoribosyl transferase